MKTERGFPFNNFVGEDNSRFYFWNSEGDSRQLFIVGGVRAWKLDFTVLMGLDTRTDLHRLNHLTFI